MQITSRINLPVKMDRNVAMDSAFSSGSCAELFRRTHAYRKLIIIAEGGSANCGVREIKIRIDKQAHLPPNLLAEFYPHQDSWIL